MDKNTAKIVHIVTFSLMFLGALNWGLVAFKYNLVELVLGGSPMLVQLVYILIALSAVYVMATHRTDCKICGDAKKD